MSEIKTDGFAVPAAAAVPRAAKPTGEDGDFSALLEASLQGLFQDPDPVAEERITPQELDISGVAFAGPGAGRTRAMKQKMADLIRDVKRIRTELQNAVYGQDHAVNTFVTGYFQAGMLAVTESAGQRPKATFLFAGPPGVGKTFLAETAAKALGLPFRRFDMSEYADKEANVEFCGSDKVYKNGKPGNVTGFVAAHPKCLLLFDEIEKAHMCAINLFLQMLDAGRLRDNYTDQEVSFGDAIIILTTNAGRQLYENHETGDLSDVSRKVIIKALQKDTNPTTGAALFPPAICSRFASGNVAMFNHVGVHDLCRIVKREIERHARALEKETGIALQIDERVYTALLYSEGSAADARTVRSRAESFFNHELYELLRLMASEKEVGIEGLETIRISVDLERADPGVAKLFTAGGPARILMVAGPETVKLCREKAPAFEYLVVREPADGLEALKQHIDLALLDMKWGAGSDAPAVLNLEDTESPARALFKLIKAHRKDLPVYLLEHKDSPLKEEEKVSYKRQGIRGVLRLSSERNLSASLAGIAADLHRQSGMVTLAKENKLIAFETAQSVSGNGKHARIRLFDFAMETAVESEDAGSVLAAASRPDVGFHDVIGAEEAKKELAYFVEYLKDPKQYVGTGVKAPRGVLLYGPPGTGKTMLARAMAAEAGVTFLAAEGNEFRKRYVGEGAEKVHTLFKTARKYAPAILFVDEIDAIAKERRGAVDGNREDTTLTAFLTEMDGFANDPTRPVFVLAATNFDVEPGGTRSLDPALMRRFDRRVYMDLPGKADRVRFLKKKAAENPALDISETMIENIAVRSTGMSLAELESALELALRSAIRERCDRVNDAILEEAFETFRGGEKKNWDTSQLERIARHEAGHALLSCLDGQIPSYLTIVARGSHGGYTQNAVREGKGIYTKDELLAAIRVALGGRAAELVCYGERDGVSTGAGGDLVSANELARQLVCCYGMDEEFGLVVVSGAEAGSAEVRTVIGRILKEQLDLAVDQLQQNRDQLDRLVNALLERSHMNEKEIRAVLYGADDNAE